MLEINDNKKYFTVYDNIYDFSQYLNTKQRKQGRENSSETGDSDFCGTDSYTQANDFMLYGDENTYNKILSEKKNINVDKILGNATKRKTFENNVYGCIPNVPAYLVGTPMNMLNKEPNMVSHKIVNIYLDITVPWHVDKETIIKNGVLYLTVIDLLEKSGYRCNLYSGCATEFNDKGVDNLTSYMLVRIKTDREPLNLKKICFTIANPSMLRRMHFRWSEVNDFEYDCTQHGYGHFADEKVIKKDLEKYLKDNIIVWSYKHESDKNNLEDIIARLKKEGITLE